MKIVNFKRFISFVIIALILICIFILIFNNKVLSKSDIRYINYIVQNNDSLWSIASSIKKVPSVATF